MIVRNYEEISYEILENAKRLNVKMPSKNLLIQALIKWDVITNEFIQINGQQKYHEMIESLAKASEIICRKIRASY